MRTIPIVSPRSGEVDINLPVFDEPLVGDCVLNARQAQKAWWHIGLAERINTLKILAETIEQQKTLLIEALAQDTGRLNESVLEVDGVISAINRWCEQAPELLLSSPEKPGEIPFLALKQSYLPYAVVGVISPWNFPLLLSFVDVIPALLVGSAVVIKPSEVTSRFITPLQHVINKIPRLTHIIQLVSGDGQTGAAVIEHVDLVCFTGSVKTGRKVGEHCARKFIPAFLELGGKDPAIVCRDANIELAAKALCWGSMVNAGQSCMSLERVYVHADIADAFITALVANVAKLEHNYPDIQAGQIGPIIARSQVPLVEHQLADAKAKGAKVLTGGNVVVKGGGYYCEPTVLCHVTADMSIVSDETFAAILPVTVVGSDDEAIQLANDSSYGLSAAVFSQNVEYAQQIAEQLEAGAISINDASLTALVHEAEKQSFKLSGLGGSRMGPSSIQRFMRKKAFIRNTGVPSPWWF